MTAIRKYLAPLLLLSMAACGEPSENTDGGSLPLVPLEPARPAETTDYAARAKEVFDLIEDRYLVRDGAYRGLMRENVPAQPGDPAASYLWSYDGWMTGVLGMHRLGYDVGYANRAELFFRYRTPGSAAAPGIPGFAPQTQGGVGTGWGDRYYDDNSIVGINLVDAYEETGEQRYLDAAREIVGFLRSGYDDHLGGALWWCEAAKDPHSPAENANKPTCANGYAACFLLDYHAICPAGEKDDVLRFALRLYDWLYTTLRDPSDNTYYNAKQALGGIQTMKWTYNSGVMIQNGIRLYRITGDRTYLEQAIATAEGAGRLFIRMRSNGIAAMPDNDQWFNTKLFIALVELSRYHEPARRYVEIYERSLEYAYEHARNASGLFFEGWTNGREGRDYWLLTQTAVLESYTALALRESPRR